MTAQTVQHPNGEWHTTVTESLDLDYPEIPELIDALQSIQEQIDTDHALLEPPRDEDGKEHGPWLHVDCQKDYDFNRYSLEISWRRATTPADIEKAERDARARIATERASLERRLRSLNEGGRA